MFRVLASFPSRTMSLGLPRRAETLRLASAAALSILSRLGNLSVRIGLLVALWASLEAGWVVRAAQDPPAAMPPGMVPPAAAQANEPPEPATSTPAPTSAPAPAPTATAPPRPLPSDVVVLDGATDVVDFWRKLADRDYMILRPEPDAPQPPRAAEPAAPNQPPEYVVNSVQIRGSIDDDLAKLELGVTCSVLVPGPIWVPLRLDEPGLLAAKENSRELELRQGQDNQWEARVEGTGEHRLHVELLRPIRSGTERKSLELAIPEAPATSIDLTLPEAVFDVDLGSGETIGRTTTAEGKRVRLFGHIAPRSRLVLGWSEPSASGSRAAPLLTAQVEMAVDVDSESIATRSSWAIRCERGVARSLQIRLDDDEVVARLQLNDQFPASGIEQAEVGNFLNIPLDDPLRPGEIRRLVLETRRTSTAGGPPVVFSGYPLTNAGEQSGAIGITHGPDLFLNIASTRGLRRIDPRDLPTALKARPGTTIALQFLEPGLHLELGVESSPPLYRAESTTDLTFESDIVRNETTINLQRVRGVLFEIEIGVPPELKIISIGPPELVESTTTPLQESAGADDPGGRTLKIRLTALGRDQRSLILKLAGTQPIPNSGDALIGLFAPRGAVSTTTSFALHSGRGLTVEPLDESLTEDGPPPLAPASSVGLARALEGLSPLPTPAPRFRTHRNLETLSARLERHALAITHDSNLAATVSRRFVGVRQETALQVRHGTLQSLIVRVPERAAALWEVSGGGTIRREDLGLTAKGIRRYRLTFDRPIADDSILIFRYRLPLSRALETTAPAEISIPWIAIEEGSSGNLAVDLSSDPDVALNVEDPNWARMDEGAEGDSQRAQNHIFRLNPQTAATSLNVLAQPLESVALPRLVVSRALLQSTLGFDGELRIRAWYALETHPGSLTLSPPENAQWLRARVDGRVIEQIDANPDGPGYRLELSDESRSKPVVIDLEYRIPAKEAQKSWGPPVLLDGADVLQSYWLARVPWKSALIGVPTGWSDENRWYWDYYVWKRSPIASVGELVGWVAGPSAQADLPLGASEVDSSVFHGYLFGRTGAGADLKPWVASRAWIIVVCSGLVLLAGLGLFLFPISERWILGGGAILGLTAAIFVHPIVIALFLQAATPGFLLVLLGWLVHRSLRRDAGLAAARATTSSSVGAGYESSRRSAFAVGSDDSTAIRRRVPSTLDYRSEPSTPDSDFEAARGAGTKPAPRAE